MAQFSGEGKEEEEDEGDIEGEGMFDADVVDAVVDVEDGSKTLQNVEP